MKLRDLNKRAQNWMDIQSDAIAIEQGECGLSLVDGRSLMNSGGHPLGTKSHLWSTMACSWFNQHHVSYQGMLFWAYRTKANNRYVCLTKAQHCQLCLPLFHAKHYPAQQALRQDHAWRNTTTTRRTQVSSFLHLSECWKKNLSKCERRSESEDRKRLELDCYWLVKRLPSISLP